MKAFRAKDGHKPAFVFSETGRDSVEGGILFFIFLHSVFGKVSLMALGYAVRCDAHVPEDITTRVRVYKALPHWYMSVTGSTERLADANSVRT